MIIYNVKIFSKDTMPYHINNGDLSLLKIINGAPIVKSTQEDNDEIVVGFVNHVEKKDGMFFGNIYIHPKYAKQRYNITSVELIFNSVINNSIYIENIIFHVD